MLKSVCLYLCMQFFLFETNEISDAPRKQTTNSQVRSVQSSSKDYCLACNGGQLTDIYIKAT